MDRIRFVDQWVFGVDRYQQDQIREAQGDAAAALWQHEQTLETIAGLRAKLVAQQEELSQLGLLVGVLVRMLGEQGGVDPKVLRYRVDAELEAVEEAKLRARQKAQSATPTGPQEQCVRCDRRVPRTATTLTPEGPTCDECVRLGT